MASIAKRPDGRWRARYRDEAGREHSRHFTRKIDGQRWLDEVTSLGRHGAVRRPQGGEDHVRDLLRTVGGASGLGGRHG